MPKFSKFPLSSISGNYGMIEIRVMVRTNKLPEHDSPMHPNALLTVVNAW